MNLPGWRLRILATGLNRKVLDRAAEDRFLQLEVNRGLPERSEFEKRDFSLALFYQAAVRSFPLTPSGIGPSQLRNSGA